MEQPFSAVPTSWRVFEQLTDAHIQDFRQAGIDALQAQLLYNRGVKAAEAMRAFLDARYDKIPDPFAFIDMPRTLERIQRALTQGEHITVYGDYDADGVTSAALLTRTLRTLGHPNTLLDYHIPNRLSAGRGLNIETLDTLKEGGTSLLITTDCGSSDVEQVAYARTLGIDVIISDHHYPPMPRPDAYAMINPWRPDCSYGERYLCGVGIAFKLAQALYRAYKRSTEAEDLLDLVAIGTIADIAPLLGENHTLVRLGLQRLNQTHKPGLLALIRNARLQLGKIRERDIAHALAPRINAAGRMQDASIAFELLMTDDDEQARRYAEELEALNIARQQQTELLMNEVREEVRRRPDDQVVLVSGKDWPEGIIGLVAGKLADEFNRPVFVLSKGPEFSRGSARSAASLNIIQALGARADLFVRYGGHAQAAGFTIANTGIEDLRQHLLSWHEGSHDTEVLAMELAELGSAVMAPEQTSLGTQRMVDLVFMKPERLKYSTYSKIQQLGPFGAANPEPIFKLEGLRLVSCWASGVDGRNLRMRLTAPGVQFNGVLIRGGSQLQLFNGVKNVTVIFHLEPAWNPSEGESKEEISLRLLHVEAVH